ncbi:hypothetical protein RM533_08405 [Croceicoccus sp. F390]|uniref:Uncharacterized protein n=1 Tax=Croceicoccus esteveae TaxID=3075597 RepID=A0ABU2ZHW6_9SPHN|nr:hypothetical protein [Croceicoccus sp. F390]MDT0576206.1 hypothetical protein [Croceicoccus sp. F390]
MTSRSPLDDPDNSSFAWSRFKRLMWFMAVFTIVMIVLSLGVLYWRNGPISIHFYIATALGVGFAMLLMSALMGLVFMSSGTGHDESIDDRLGDNTKDVW